MKRTKHCGRVVSKPVSACSAAFRFRGRRDGGVQPQRWVEQVRKTLSSTPRIRSTSVPRSEAESLCSRTDETWTATQAEVS